MSQINFNQVLQALHTRIEELPENFQDFIKSECNWSTQEYSLLLKHPEKCTLKDLKVIVKIADDLAHDLQTLIKRYKQTLKVNNATL